MQLTRSFSVALVLGAAILGAQAASSTARSISMEECVQLALQHNLDVQIQRINPITARYALRGAYAAYDPSLEASVEHSFGVTPGGVDPQGRNYGGIEQERDTIGLGISGLLPYGTTYRLGGNLSDTHGTRPTFQPDFSRPLTIDLVTNNFLNSLPLIYAVTNYDRVLVRDPFENSSSFVGINLRQPLLKDFWIDAPRLTIALNRKNIKLSELALQLQIMSTVRDVQVAYLNLLAARESLKAAEIALRWGEQLLRETKKRVEVGVLAPLDEKSAESEVAARKAGMLAAQSELVIRQTDLKGLLTDKYTEWQDVQLEPTEKLTAIVQVFSRQDSWHKGLTMRPDLLQAKVDLEKQNIRLRYDRNQLFPSLDLTGSYGWAGSADEFSGALGGVTRGNSPSYSVGTVLTIPLSRQSARYNYRTTKAVVEQSLLRLKKLEQDIMVQIDIAIAQAQSSLEQVDATKKAREYAEAAVQAEQKKLDNGKSTSYDVLQRQRDLTRSLSEEIRSLSVYNNALTSLAFFEGSILAQSGIRIELK